MKFGLPSYPPETLARLEKWTPEQTALFSVGLAPEGMITGAQIVQGDTEKFTANVLFRVRLFEAHSRDPLAPSDWLAWCRESGHGFNNEPLAAMIEGRRQTGRRWTVKPMQRGSDTLRDALYEWLIKRDQTQPRPTAAQVMAAFREVRPNGVFEVMRDEVKFYGRGGELTTVNEKQLRDRIGSMTENLMTD